MHGYNTTCFSLTSWQQTGLFATCLQIVCNFRLLLIKWLWLPEFKYFVGFRTKHSSSVPHWGAISKSEITKTCHKIDFAKDTYLQHESKNKNAKHDIVEPQLGKCQPSCWDSIHNQKRYQRACSSHLLPTTFTGKGHVRRHSKEAVAIYSQGECFPQTLTLLAPSSYCLNSPV